MSLGWLLPGALWGLLALLLPVVLHLYRRRQTPQPLDFAALAFIEPQRRPRRRLQLRQPWLLLLRCLLLAAVVLWLAQPLLFGAQRAGSWQLVAPGVDLDALPRDATPAAEWRWLAPGFPSLDQAPPERGDTASLIRQIDAQLPEQAALGIHLPPLLDGFDGERLRLSRHVDWHVLPAAGTAPPPSAISPLRVAVAGDPPTAQATNHLNALLAAWQAHATERVQALRVHRVPELPVDTLLWAANEPLPADWQTWLEQGGRVVRLAAADEAVAVTLWRSSAGAELGTRRVGAGELRRLDCALQPDCLPELFDAPFPQTVIDWLSPRPQPPGLADAAQMRPSADGPAPAPPGQPLAPWLGMLAAILFALERWFASAGRSR